MFFILLMKKRILSQIIPFFINNLNLQNLMFFILFMIKQNTFPISSVFFILIYTKPCFLYFNRKKRILTQIIPFLINYIFTQYLVFYFLNYLGNYFMIKKILSQIIPFFINNICIQNLVFYTFYDKKEYFPKITPFFINNFNMQNLMFLILFMIKKNTFPNNSVFNLIILIC